MILKQFFAFTPIMKNQICLWYEKLNSSPCSPRCNENSSKTKIRKIYSEATFKMHQTIGGVGGTESVC